MNLLKIQKDRKKSETSGPEAKQNILQTRKLERSEREAKRASYKVMPPSIIKSNYPMNKNISLGFVGNGGATRETASSQGAYQTMDR